MEQNDVIFVIEKSTIFKKYLSEIIDSYIVPVLSFFSGGVTDDSDIFFTKNHKVQFAVVFYGTELSLLGSWGQVETYGPTNSHQDVLNAIQNGRYTCKNSTRQAFILEGLQATLCCFDRMHAKHADGETVRRFCVLVTQSAPMSHPWSPTSPEKVIGDIKKKGVQLSVISAHKLVELHRLFDAVGGDDGAVVASQNYTVLPQHMVLLSGIILAERSRSPVSVPALGTNLSSLSGPLSAPSMGSQVPPATPSPGPAVSPVPVAIIQPTQMSRPSVAVIPPPTVALQPISSVGRGRALTVQQQRPRWPADANVGVMSANSMGEAMQWAGNGNQPRMMESMGGVGGQMGGTGGQMIGSGGQMVGTGAQMGGSGGQMGGTGGQIGGGQINVVGGQMSGVGSQMGGSIGQLGMPGTQMVGQMGGAIGGPSQQQQMQMSIPVSDSMTAGLDIEMDHQIQVGNSFLSGALPDQGQQASGHPGSNVPSQRSVVWQGTIELQEKRADNPSRILHHVTCKMTSAVVNGEPEVNTDGWSSHLTMQLIPKKFLSSLGQTFFRNVRTVMFLPDQSPALEMLTASLMREMAGCVHVASNAAVPSDVRVIILLFSAEKRAYVGFIPVDQVSFVNKIKSVIATAKKGQIPNAIGMGGGPPNMLVTGVQQGVPISSGVGPTMNQAMMVQQQHQQMSQQEMQQQMSQGNVMGSTMQVPMGQQMGQQMNRMQMASASSVLTNQLSRPMQIQQQGHPGEMQMQMRPNMQQQQIRHQLQQQLQQRPGMASAGMGLGNMAPGAGVMGGGQPRMMQQQALQQNPGQLRQLLQNQQQIRMQQQQQQMMMQQQQGMRQELPQGMNQQNMGQGMTQSGQQLQDGSGYMDML